MPSLSSQLTQRCQFLRWASGPGSWPGGKTGWMQEAGAGGQPHARVTVGGKRVDVARCF